MQYFDELTLYTQQFQGSFVTTSNGFKIMADKFGIVDMIPVKAYHKDIIEYAESMGCEIRQPGSDVNIYGNSEVIKIIRNMSDSRKLVDTAKEQALAFVKADIMDYVTDLLPKSEGTKLMRYTAFGQYDKHRYIKDR